MQLTHPQKDGTEAQQTLLQDTLRSQHTPFKPPKCREGSECTKLSSGSHKEAVGTKGVHERAGWLFPGRRWDVGGGFLGDARVCSSLTESRP